MKLKTFLIVTLLLCAAWAQAQKVNRKLLQGPWFGKESDDGSAVFYIDPDSVTYIEDFAKFKYIITKDTFDIKTDEPHYKELIIKLTKDSLILKELPSMEINRYWKQ